MEEEKIKTVNVDEEIRELLLEVQSNPEKYPEESKLILFISTWRRTGTAFIDYSKFEIIDGDVIKIILREWSDQYPYCSGTDYAILPLSSSAVIRYTQGNNYEYGQLRTSECYYIYSQGWRRIVINDDLRLWSDP